MMPLPANCERRWGRTAGVYATTAVVALLLAIAHAQWQPSRATAASVIPVAGGERLAWTQEAPDAAVAASYRFVALVDGVRTYLSDAWCTRARNGVEYECEASLPPLQPGAHQIAVMTLDALGVASSPSQFLELGVSPFTTLGNSTERLTTRAPVCTLGGSDTCFAVDVVATGLAAPRNLHPLPDGRLLFVEGESDVRILAGDEIVSAYAADRQRGTEVRIADVAAAPDFSRTGHVFMVFVRQEGDGTTHSDIVRGRELAGRLGELLTVVPRLPTATGTVPALAVAPDGRLYVAMAAARSSGSRASAYDGHVLRFEPDGRSAAAPGWPVLANGHSSPSAIQVDAEGRAWLAALNIEPASPSMTVLTPTSASGPSSQMAAFPRTLVNWPGPATGVRALTLAYHGSSGAPTLYIAPRGLAALLIASGSVRSSTLTVEQLSIPNIEPTGLAVQPSGVMFVGGMDHGTTASSRGTLLRLTPLTTGRAR